MYIILLLYLTFYVYIYNIQEQILCGAILQLKVSLLLRTVLCVRVAKISDVLRKAS